VRIFRGRVGKKQKNRIQFPFFPRNALMMLQIVRPFCPPLAYLSLHEPAPTVRSAQLNRIFPRAPRATNGHAFPYMATKGEFSRRSRQGVRDTVTVFAFGLARSATVKGKGTAVERKS
jgi:hypothetical protein